MNSKSVVRALGAAAVLMALAGRGLAADPALSIELNKLEDIDGKCRASLVIDNRLGRALDRFNIDLFVFDRAGVIAQRLLVDLAPLRDDKTTVATFALVEGPCSGIGRVLVNDIPACRGADGTDLDCVAALAVSSRTGTPLVK